MQLAAVRRYAWIAVGAVLVTLGIFHLRGSAAATPPAVAATAPDPGSSLGDIPAPGFALTANTGAPVSLSEFRGKVVVMPFIDSRCVTVCPLTAIALRKMQQLLGARAADVQILAVNSNPLYTTVADVQQWSQENEMTGHWLYATGSDAQLQPIWTAYHIEALIVDGADMHTPAVYVITPQGREDWVFTSSQDSNLDAEAQLWASRVRTLLA